MPQQARAEPVLSDRLAMALVVDASAAGSPMLPVGLAGAANLVLAAPPSARSTVVADSTPPTVAVPWPSGPVDTLRGLSAVRSGGARSTSAALDLAVAQLPADATAPRLVVLYTGAADAGGEPARTLAERMRAAGVVLAVVSPAGEGPDAAAATRFWAAAAEGTGGMAATVGPSGVIGAFDAATAALGTRYLLTMPEPARLPATVVVRVDTGSRHVDHRRAADLARTAGRRRCRAARDGRGRWRARGGPGDRRASCSSGDGRGPAGPPRSRRSPTSRPCPTTSSTGRRCGPS